jgi:FAD/FMN-containing dehydrogenase
MKQDEFIHDVAFKRVGIPEADIESLGRELVDSIEGEVRFDKGSRMLYVTDASNYRLEPLGIVVPINEKDIIKTVELARKYNAPILSRGGGTSLAGQCTNIAVIMDMSTPGCRSAAA